MGATSTNLPRVNGRAAGRRRALPVLVAGGAGFIGSHLCERLLRAGSRVLCLDNFSTSDPENVAHLARMRGFRLVRADVARLDPVAFERVGAIFNLACPASPVRYQEDPLQTLDTCVRGMDNLLRLARRDGARILQASTSEIYGHPDVHPQHEGYWGHVNPIGPRSCYDEGKRCAETLCFIYRQQYGVAARVARIFNTYGPRMNRADGRVLVNFVHQALGGEPLTVYGDGQQTRSFCYVDDLVEALLRLFESDARTPVNLGNPEEMSILSLARRVISATGTRSPIVMRPLPVDDPPRRRPDIALARRVLGWAPRTPLEAGLRLTIADCRYRAERRRVAAGSPGIAQVAAPQPPGAA